jgi:hypothetical protein
MCVQLFSFCLLLIIFCCLFSIIFPFVFSARLTCCSVYMLHVGSGFEGLRVEGLFGFLLVGSFVCFYVYFMYT